MQHKGLQKFLHTLGVDESERPRFWRMGYLFLLLSAGFEIGKIGRDTFFITRVGPEQIPYMYLFIALGVFVLSAIYSRFLATKKRDRLMMGIQAGGFLFSAGFWYVVQFSPGAWEYSPHVLYCVTEAFVLFTTMHYWTFANDIFSANEGKRFFPLLGGAGILGTILGGIITNLVAHYLSASYLLLSWALLLLITLQFTERLRKMASSARAEAREAAAAAPPEPAPKENALLQIWREPLIRTLTFMAFPMWIIIYVVDFSFFSTLNRTFPDQDQLAGFLGAFISFCSVVGLLLQFVFTPRLIRHFGVSAASLVYPLTLTIGTTSLLIFTLMPESEAGSLQFGGLVMLVLFARFCDVGIYYSVYDSTAQLLYYAVPERLRAQSRAFVSGLIFPVSIMLAGVLILSFRALGEPIYNVAFVGLAMAFLLVVLALNVTPDYLKALLGRIAKQNEEERLEMLDEIAKVSESDTYYVLLQSITSHDQAEADFAVSQIQAMDVRDMFIDLEEIVGDIAPRTLEKLVPPLAARMDPEATHFIEKARARMAAA